MLLRSLPGSLRWLGHHLQALRMAGGGLCSMAKDGLAAGLRPFFWGGRGGFSKYGGNGRNPFRSTQEIPLMCPLQMPTVLCKCQRNNGFNPWFQSDAKWISSTHSRFPHQINRCFPFRVPLAWPFCCSLCGRGKGMTTVPLKAPCPLR